MSLDPINVPIELRGLIPLAEEFGISDDTCRFKKIEETPPHKVMELKHAVEEKDDELDDWLAGEESKGPEFSNEYIAFSAMRMAVDML